MITLHLNGKFPSTKTSWDFEGVFDTIEHNWFCPEYFFVHRTHGYYRMVTLYRFPAKINLKAWQQFGSFPSGLPMSG